jgi:hypothetical protein
MPPQPAALHQAFPPSRIGQEPVHRGQRDRLRLALAVLLRALHAVAGCGLAAGVFAFALRLGDAFTLALQHDFAKGGCFQEGQDRVGRGLDVRTDGGYIVAPPSIVDGGKYKWLFWKGALPEALAWLIEQQMQLRAEREQQDRERRARSIATEKAVTDEAFRKRLKGLAHSNLKRYAAWLASKLKPGRNDLLYTTTCFMAPFIREGLVGEAVVADAFENACEQNGLRRDNGWKGIRSTMEAAMQKSTDVLPSDLPDRETRKDHSTPGRTSHLSAICQPNRR